MVLDITGMVEVAFPLTQAAAVIPLPVHTSTVVLRAISGMAVNVKKVLMKDQIGQILLPGPNLGVNLPRAAVALTLIGIMAAVTAETQVLIMEAVAPHPAINARV